MCSALAESSQGEKKTIKIAILHKISFKSFIYFSTLNPEPIFKLIAFIILR